MIYRHVQVRVPEELAEWYDRTFPGLSKQDFLLGTLESLRGLVQTGSVPSQRDITSQAITSFIEYEIQRRQY